MLDVRCERIQPINPVMVARYGKRSRPLIGLECQSRRMPAGARRQSTQVSSYHIQVADATSRGWQVRLVHHEAAGVVVWGRG